MPLTSISRRLLDVVVACAFALAPAAAIAQDQTPEPSPLAVPTDAPTPLAASPDGAWVVVAYDAWEQGLAGPLPDSRLTLTLLADGQLEGETACGRFAGGWWRDGDELSMGVAPTGNLGCGDKKAAEAIGFSTALAASTRWQATDAGIELLDSTGATRVLLETLGLGDPTGYWNVSRYRRPNGKLVEPVLGSPMSLTLVDDGTIEGSSGCRLLLGEYRSQGAGITLGPLEVEGMPCEADEARAERQLLRALGDVVYWEQDGDALTFLDGFDEPLVELVRVIDPAAAGEVEG